MTASSPDPLDDWFPLICVVLVAFGVLLIALSRL